MKKIILISITFIFSWGFLSAQIEGPPNLSDSDFMEKTPIKKIPCDNWFITYIKNCRGRYDITFKFDCDPNKTYTTNLNEVEGDGASTYWIYHQESNNLVKVDDNSAMITNVFAYENQLQLKLIQATSSGDVIGAEVLNYSMEKEQGITNISVDLDRRLGQFTNNVTPNGNGPSLVESFCGESVNVIEFITLLEGILDLTQVQVCELISVFTNYNSSTFTQGNGYLTIDGTLCQLLLDWEDNIKTDGNNGGNNDEENDCACEMIITNTTANHHGWKDRSVDNECFDYIARHDDFNYGKKGSTKRKGTNIKWSEAVMGASHAAAYATYADMGRGTSHPFNKTTNLGKSTLSYRMVCVDPSTIAPDIANCSSCKKRVTLRYHYSAEIMTRAQKGGYLWGSNEMSHTTVTDWAVFSITDDRGNIIDTMTHAITAASECADENGQADSLDSLLASTGSLSMQILTALESEFDIESAVGIADEVLDIAQTFLFTGSCDAQQEIQESFFDGTISFNLEPGIRYTAQIASGAGFSGRSRQEAETIAYAISDVVLAGYVETLVDSTGQVPEYCECEKLANYVVGSMEDEVLTDPPQHDTDDELGDEPFWSSVTNNYPYGWGTLKVMAGEHIGLAGNWGDVFEVIGCCEVDIPCHADCQYLRGCDDVIPSSNRISTNEPNKNTTYPQTILEEVQDTKDTITPEPSPKPSSLDKISYIKNNLYKVYPSPVNDILTFERDKSLTLDAELIIYSKSGQIVLTSKILKEDKLVKLNIALLQPGIYFLAYKDIKNKKILKFVKH